MRGDVLLVPWRLAWAVKRAWLAVSNSPVSGSVFFSLFLWRFDSSVAPKVRRETGNTPEKENADSAGFTSPLGRFSGTETNRTSWTSLFARSGLRKSAFFLLLFYTACTHIGRMGGTHFEFLKYLFLFFSGWKVLTLELGLKTSNIHHLACFCVFLVRKLCGLYSWGVRNHTEQMPVRHSQTYRRPMWPTVNSNLRWPHAQAYP